VDAVAMENVRLLGCKSVAFASHFSEQKNGIAWECGECECENAAQRKGDSQAV